MSGVVKSRTSKSRTSSVTKPAQGGQFAVPAWLARSSIYKRVPVRVRIRLDKAILFRPPESPTLEAVADKFKLSERYNISLASLRNYARKLEQFVKPAMGSQLLAELLGCLPESYRQQVASGNQVLLLSKVLQALTMGGADALSVADLAKFSTILSGIASRTNMGSKKSTGSGPKKKGPPAESEPSGAEPGKVAEAVRMLYGLPWPPEQEQKN